MVKRNSIKHKISESLDLPKEIVMDIPNIKVIGDNEITIENHKGILEYSRELLRMNSVSGIIKISGQNLQIKEINQDDICINGQIFSIEFIK